MRNILITALLLTLSACASAPVQLSKNAEDEYNRASRMVDDAEHSRAAMVLEKFSAKYPYSKYATPAELLRLKAAYMDEQYVLSETLGLRFMDAHPDHKDKVYAQYLVAMSYYKQSSSSDLDQAFSHRSRDAFLDLNKAYPANPYTDDIHKYLNILTNRVAKHELMVGKFYFDKKLYVAATNRLLIIKNDYLSSDSAAESLYYLAASYAALHLPQLGKEITALLQHDYANNAWSKKSANTL